MSYAMDPGKRFGAPLYRTPRTWTHARLLNFGGLTSTIYPIRVPGGGQLFGRTPIEIFDPQERSPAFADGPVLARAGDRHRYESIAREEYDEIRAAVRGRHLRVPGRGGHFRLRGLRRLACGDRGARGEARPREHVGAGLMLEVIHGGLRTTVQDMGRRGGQALGDSALGRAGRICAQDRQSARRQPAGRPARGARGPGRGRP